MGMSPSIQDLENRDEAFCDYLQELQTNLQVRSGEVDAQQQAMINSFYSDNKYTDAQDLVSGQNFDFIDAQEFSLANLKSTVDAVSAAVFAGGNTPAGAKVNDAGQQAAAAKLGPEVGGMANLELYMAGQVFDVLSNVVLSFGTSTEITFNTALQSKSLGYGLQLFVAVSAQSFQSPNFFDNNYFYGYRHVYDVKFSGQQADADPSQALITLYEDQIAAFKQREEGLLNQLESGDITAQVYASAEAAYDALIAACQAELQALRAKTTATQ
jgi:hypothetical protein